MSQHKNPRKTPTQLASRRRFHRRVSNDTAEYPKVRLRPEDIGTLLPKETLSSWAIQKFVHELDRAPDSEDAIGTLTSEFPFQSEISSSEWNAWEDDWESVHESPVGASDDWLNPNAMLQYSFARMEMISDPEMFERQLRSLLRQFLQAFAVESVLSVDTISLIDGLFERLYDCAVRLFMLDEHHLAFVLFQWLVLARPTNKLVLSHLQQLSSIVRIA